MPEMALSQLIVMSATNDHSLSFGKSVLMSDPIHRIKCFLTRVGMQQNQSMWVSQRSYTKPPSLSSSSKYELVDYDQSIDDDERY